MGFDILKRQLNLPVFKYCTNMEELKERLAELVNNETLYNEVQNISKISALTIKQTCDSIHRDKWKKMDEYVELLKTIDNSLIKILLLTCPDKWYKHEIQNINDSSPIDTLLRFMDDHKQLYENVIMDTKINFKVLTNS